MAKAFTEKGHGDVHDESAPSFKLDAAGESARIRAERHL
jgi:hypothetical protein